MLLISQISNIELHSPEWLQYRLGRFTSSEIYNLMGDDELTKGAISYIYRKVGEELSGVAASESFETTAMAHGNVYEVDAIRRYAEREGIKFLITQKMIKGLEDRYSSTPDAIKIISNVPNEEAYNVNPIEVKCPMTYEAYIALALCETAQDVKKVEKKYYWQLLDQMYNCGALTGTLVIYHPNFKVGQLKVIDFRVMECVPSFGATKYPMKSDLDMLKKRKLAAISKFNEIKDKISCLQ